MIKTVHLRLILIILTGFVANVASGQKTFTWNGSSSSNWATAANWTVSGSGSTSTYPGESSATATDLVIINKNDTPNAPIIATSPPNAVNRVTINNALGTIAGSTLTINSGVTLTITSLTATALVLNGGNLINNGTLTINNSAVGSSGFETKGITCGTPTVLPTSANPTVFSYSGTGTLNVNLTSATAFMNSAAIAVVGTNAFSTYNISLNPPPPAPALPKTNFSLSSANATYAIRAQGGSGACPLIISGGGFTMGTIDVPANGGLLAAAAQSTITVSAGTVLTLNSIATNNTSGVVLSNGSAAARTIFTNNGTIAVAGPTSASGVSVSTFSGTGNPNIGIDFINTGIVSVDIEATGTTTLETSPAAFLIPNGFGENNTNALLTVTNTGTITFKNSSIAVGNGHAIWVTGRGQRTKTTFNNNANGTLNINGTVANVAQSITLNNNSIINSNSSLSGFVAINNNSAGAIDFSTLETSALDASNALPSATINAGTINTGKGAGAKLSIISGVTDASTGTIAPGGLQYGIADFSKAGTPAIASKLQIQVLGSTTAGVDFDQIVNTGLNGGLTISAATLEITSLYAPISSVSIPIVTTSGTGTISGTFASVTGLTSGWTISYASPTSVNLVYTFVVIPTLWTGIANNDFFNEANWKDSVTNLVPAANSINPGANINLHLQISSPATITASGSMQFGTGSLAVGAASGDVTLSATSVSGGAVTVNENGYINLSSATPLLNDVQINFTSGIGWIRTLNSNARTIFNTYLGQIKVNASPAVYASNLRLDNYYLNGCVIRANLAATAPLTIFDNTNRLGTSAAITVNTIHSNTGIANAMNNKMESFVLKKGFMATIAIENDGTGKSKNYVASEVDLVVNVLPQTLQNSISFIRVLPWNWVNKKGRNDIGTDLNTTWRYRWNPNDPSTLDFEFSPMAWGHTSANDPSDINLLIGKYNTPYIMSFNEPDDCSGQSGQYGNLCQTDVAVGYHKNLMKTGMRIVSPGGREEAPFGWLEEFYNKAAAQDVRVDVIAVHWYDWGSNPTVNTNPTALTVFNRFKAYLTNVYNTYGLPIWITEFNANPARSNQINADFLALAMPYLESLEYIERYCWYPYNVGTHFSGWNDNVNPPVETNKILTPVGIVYSQTLSSPAIPEPQVPEANNLDLSNNPNVALNKPATASSAANSTLASRAVDGNTTDTDSRWLVNLATTPLPAWLEVNLEGSFTVDSFRISEAANSVRNFQFQVWNPSLNAGVGGWSAALTESNNSNSSLVTYRTITPIVTTRVRLLITAHNDSSTSFIRMFELEVYGLKNNPTWTGGTSTAWTTAANWSTGIVPDQFSNVLIAAGATFQPTLSTTTTINTLAIEAGAALTVTAPNLTVAGIIDIDGTMDIANNSNLLQGEEFLPNSGNISIRRNTAMQRLAYTNWSSPVANQNALAFSPLTAINRFYTYNEANDNFAQVASPSTTNLIPAVGYSVRAPNTFADAPAPATAFVGTFTGIPNNGSYSFAAKQSTPTKGYNLIGNPYPSTLSASAFFAANPSINALYFWNNAVLNSTGGANYATKTTLTSVRAASDINSLKVPNDFIAVGQGFFALVNANATLNFTNAMRPSNNSSSVFFRNASTDKSLFKLNLLHSNVSFNQIAIGYMNGATNGVDNQIDAIPFAPSNKMVSSLISNVDYVIQGRSLPFVNTDVVSLGFKTDVAGNYSFTTEALAGVFANNQDIYLKDNLVGTTHNIKQSPYNFTTNAGTFNARFEIVYVNSVLGIANPNFNDHSVFVFVKDNNININSGKSNMKNIQVFDVQGRLVYDKKEVNATAFEIQNLKVAQAVLVVKITAEDGKIVSKKIVY